MFTILGVCTLLEGKGSRPALSRLDFQESMRRLAGNPANFFMRSVAPEIHPGVESYDLSSI